MRRRPAYRCVRSRGRGPCWLAAWFHGNPDFGLPVRGQVHGTGAGYNRTMTFHATALFGSKPEQYAQLLEQARALMHGEHDRIANAANLSALLWRALPDLNWCGFYLFDGTELVVGPFRSEEHTSELQSLMR